MNNLIQATILMLWQEAPEYAEVKEEDEEYVLPLDLLFRSIERAAL